MRLHLLAAATALTAALHGATPAAFTTAPSDKERGIGMTLSADVSASASKKVTLILFYTQ